MTQQKKTQDDQNQKQRQDQERQKQERQKQERQDSSEQEIIREDESTTVDTNAGPDAQQGTIADHDVEGTAPVSHADEDPSEVGQAQPKNK